MTDTAPPIRTTLLVYDGCDLLDVGGPYEVMLTANRLADRQGRTAPFAVHTVAASPKVTAYGGLGLVASHQAADPDAIDLLVVPGLVDLDTALADRDLLERVAALTARAAVVASVCTGAFLLAATGLLRGRRATTHHEDTALLRARDDVGEVVDGVRWVDDGDVVTAAGLSSGLALGLHLVDRFAGRGLALATARQLEHDWDADGGELVRPVAPTRSETETTREPYRAKDVDAPEERHPVNHLNTTPGPHTADGPAVRWTAFRDQAPSLAVQVRARFAAHLHHVVGTVRPSGAPRLSGTEVTIDEGGVRLGMMAGSRKLADVRRDARVELHSAPLEEDLAAGDAKLTGRLIERTDPLPDHPGTGHFDLLLERASLVRVEGEQLLVTTWDPQRGQHEERRR